MKRILFTLLAVFALATPVHAQSAAVITPSPVPSATEGDTLVFRAALGRPVWTAPSEIVQPLTDAEALIRNASDGTKQLHFDLSGLASESEVTWTIPDLSGTVALSGASQAVTFGTINTFTFNQSVASGATPTFTGTNFTGIPPAAVTGTAAILGANTFTGLQTMSAGVSTDTISEFTSDAGVTIDSVLVKDGAIVIGTDTAVGDLTIEGTSAEITVTQTNDDSHGARLHLRSSRAGGTLQDGDTLFSIAGLGHDGTTYTTAARIVAQVDGAVSAGAVPGRLLFGTTDGVSAPTERLRIDQHGVSTFTRSGFGATSTDGVVIVNATDAADGAQQYSPRFVLQGEGWKSDATAASQTVAFASEVRPVQGTSAPTGSWALMSSINGGAYSDVLRITSAGQVQHATGTSSSPAISFSADTDKGFDHIANNVMGYFTGGVERFRYSDGNYYLTGIIGFGVTSGVPTATIARVANGAFAIGNITTGVRLNAGTDGTLAVQNFAGSAGATVSMATLSVIGASGFTLTNAASTTALFSGQVSAPGFVTSSAGAAYSWTGRSQLTSPADGTVLARNAAGTDRSVVQGKYFEAGVSAGLTASTTQTQGQGALTNQINEVATCANANDTVTLPAAVAGRTVTIIHNGAETLQIFPASGDDLGAGVNTATTLVAGGIVTFIAYDDTNWKEQ